MSGHAADVKYRMAKESMLTLYGFFVGEPRSGLAIIAIRYRYVSEAAFQPQARCRHSIHVGAAVLDRHANSKPEELR